MTQKSVTFSYTGSKQTWTVPTSVEKVWVTAYGAQGGPFEDGGGSQWDIGGLGGMVSGEISVTPGQTLNIYVGQKGQADSAGGGGWNGGGEAAHNRSDHEKAGGGGGATDLRIGGTSLSDRVIVAGAGGGASREYENDPNDPNDEFRQNIRYELNGGDAGGDSGSSGESDHDNAEGDGGDQMSGGSGGDGSNVLVNGGDGSLGQGGDGSFDGSRTNQDYEFGGAGGGGGYYGGGGGANAPYHYNKVGYDPDYPSAYGGTGGGGSSYITSSASNTSGQAGTNSGHGTLEISYSISELKWYDGSSYVKVPLKVYDGSNYVERVPQTYRNDGDWQ